MSTFIEEIREWLDTETRALLCPEPPTKITAIGIESYSLLLLRHGSDRQRTDEIIGAIRNENPIVLIDYPFIVAQEMTLDEAIAGQFALACCDCVSAFVRDDVVCEADSDFLQQLSDQVTGSPEFELINVTLLSIPHSEDGRRFCWQFLGMASGTAIPQTLRIFRKKARLMDHWAKKSGIDLRICEPN